MEAEVTQQVGTLLVNNLGAAGIGGLFLFFVKKFLNDAKEEKAKSDKKLDELIMINEKQNENFSDMKTRLAVSELQSQGVAVVQKDIKELEKNAALFDGKIIAAFRQIDEMRELNKELREQVNQLLNRRAS